MWFSVTSVYVVQGLFFHNAIRDITIHDITVEECHTSEVMLISFTNVCILLKFKCNNNWIWKNDTILRKLDNKHKSQRNNNDYNNRRSFLLFRFIVMRKIIREWDFLSFLWFLFFLLPLFTIITNIIYMLIMPQRENHICIMITKGQQRLLM